MNLELRFIQFIFGALALVVGLNIYEINNPSTKASKRGNFELRIFEIPFQLNPENYHKELTSIVQEKEILRWYISKFREGNAVIEAVVIPHSPLTSSGKRVSHCAN